MKLCKKFYRLKLEMIFWLKISDKLRIRAVNIKSFELHDDSMVRTGIKVI